MRRSLAKNYTAFDDFMDFLVTGHKTQAVLMMEQANAGKGHCNAILVAGSNHMIVTDASTCLCNIFNAALMSPFYIIAKWEESIRPQADTCILADPLFLFLKRKHRRLFGKEILPYSISKYIVMILTDVNINGIIAICTADMLYPRQCKHFWMLTQPPYVGFITGQTRAMNAALLTGTNTYGLSTLYIAHGIALGILQCDQGNFQIALGILRKRLIIRRYVIEQAI